MAAPSLRDPDDPPGPEARAGSKEPGSALPDLGSPIANPAVNTAGERGVTGRVLVLNASFEPINVCTVKRAIVLILKDKAEVIDGGERELHSATGTHTRPSVIRLVSYVRIPYDALRRRITRRAVFARDGWSCQYCGRTGSLTMDHVVPRSKGGDTSWENVVTCCPTCNRRKGDKLPDQAGMKPRKHPVAPQSTIFIHVASPTIPVSWQPYVSMT